MRFAALAAAFDGTLAREGRCDPRCVPALRALAATGRKLILVTGRELRELLEIFPEARTFDYLVAENGAVLHRPASRTSAILARAPPEILIQELRRRHVAPLSVGSSILTTERTQAAQLSAALAKLGLDFQLVGNDDSLIAAPSGVDKASGVAAALRELALSPRNLVAVGDAENDLPLAQLAEHAVAVSNADARLKNAVHRVTAGACSDGFLELAHDLIATDLADAPPKHRLLLQAPDGRYTLSIAPCRDSLLISGRPGSGKLQLCRRLLHQLLAAEYQCCLIGPNASAWAPQDVRCLGNAREVPRLTDVLDAVEHPACSIAVDVAALSMETRAVFAHALLHQLQALHERVSRPHAVIVDQAHRLLPRHGGWPTAVVPAQNTMIYLSEAPEEIAPEVLMGTRGVLALGSAGSARGPAFQATAAGDVACRPCFTEESGGGPGLPGSGGTAGSG